MRSVVRALGPSYIQLRTVQTIRTKDGLSHLRDVHKQQRSNRFEKQKQQHVKWKQDQEQRKQEQEQKQKRKASVSLTEPPLVSFKLSCPGCGARYQYKDSDTAGYVPHEKMMGWDSKSSLNCDRCNLLVESNDTKMYIISEERFKKVVEVIANTSSLGVIVCDIVGFPASLPPLIDKIYPLGAPVILYLNKCDILGASPARMEIIENYYRPTVTKWEVRNNFKFNDVIFGSGKTGLGLPELAVSIQKYVHRNKSLSEKDFCYLLGNINVGKSTLFNKLGPLLNNKLKTLGNATESSLPGTTVRNISSVIAPPPKLAYLNGLNRPDNIDHKLNKKDNQLSELMSQSVDTVPRSTKTVSSWFKSMIDLQLKDTTGDKLLIDTPGVAPSNSIAESVFACHHKLYCRFMTLEPGQCLSFGWYKLYFVQGIISVNIAINAPPEFPPKIITRVEDETVGYTDHGVKLNNKLYVLQGLYTKKVHSNPRRKYRTGDICLGNFGWVSFDITPGDSISVVVFGPREEDLTYRTPGFGFNLQNVNYLR